MQSEKHTWRVPEVESGQCTEVQAANLGLVYRNELGETMAECLERITAEMSETFVCGNVECKSRPGTVTCVPTTFGDRRFCSEECMAEEIR